MSPSLDVYSLAAQIFFHLVTGSTPFPGVKFADLQDQIRRGLPVPYWAVFRSSRTDRADHPRRLNRESRTTTRPERIRDDLASFVESANG